MFRFLSKTSILFIFFVLILFTSIRIYTGIEYNKVEPDIDTQLRGKVTVSYLDKHILTAVSIENFDDVQMYQNLALFLNVPLSPSTLKLIEEENGFFKKSWRHTKEFTSGFISGESKSVVGMSGSIASDMTLYGDLRDLKIEGSKYANDEKYDAFILQISLIGVALSSSQILSFGISTPLKVGTSVLKMAKKSGTLSKSFLENVSTKLSKVLETKGVTKELNFSYFKLLFKDINQMNKHTSITDTISLMKYVDRPSDLKRLANLSVKFKSNTKAVMRVLGKGALRGTKMVLKYTTQFIAQLVGLFFSILGFVMALVSKRFFIKSLKNKRYLREIIFFKPKII